MYQGGFTTTRYQRSEPSTEWHCFVIRLKPVENECFGDLKKLSRFSISRLVAMAVDKYLHLILARMEEEESNNYCDLTSSSIHKETINGIRCWYLYWGNPKTLKKGLPGIHLRSAHERDVHH